MSAESDAYSAVIGYPAAAALVGDRVYPDFVPLEKALPAVAITRVDTEYINTIHGDAPVGSAVTLEMWCMAESRLESITLADTVELAAAAAGFLVVGRRPEFDPEADYAVTVVTVRVWQ